VDLAVADHTNSQLPHLTQATPTPHQTHPTDSILEVITGQPQDSSHSRMCPNMLVWLAGRVCPF